MEERRVQTDGTEIGEFLRAVKRGHENAIEIVRELLPEGKGEKIVLAVQNRVLQAEPVKAPERMESDGRGHTFHSQEGFVDYLKKYGGEDTVILGDCRKALFEAVLDEKAEKGREWVKLAMQTHPLWGPWEGNLGCFLEMQEFVQLVVENRRSIVGEDTKELLLTISQIRMSSEVEVWNGQGKECLNGITVKTSVQGKKDAQFIPIPDSLSVCVPMLIGTDAETLEIDISIRLVGTERPPGVVLTCAEALSKRVQTFETMLAQIHAEMPDATVGLGELEYVDWDYLS